MTNSVKENFKVKDISLSDWGRKEIRLAEAERVQASAKAAAQDASIAFNKADKFLGVKSDQAITQINRSIETKRVANEVGEKLAEARADLVKLGEARMAALAGPPLIFPTNANAKFKKYFPPPAASKVDPNNTNKKIKLTDTLIGIPKIASPPNQW